jgi:GntP family gluconate:H+ symporter
MTATIVEEKTYTKRASALPAVIVVGAAIVVALASGASAILSHRPAAAQWMALRWPFVNLAISIGLVVLLISVARVHAVLALLFAAIASGFMSPIGTLSTEASMNHWVAAVELTANEFGVLASKVGIVIALASIIGMCLLESGSAEKVVRWFLDIFGEKRAGLALLVSTYIVSIPIFFETIFMLLVPLARALRRRTGKDYLMYLMGICCAGAITHTMVIPHPGPAALAGSLHINPGLTILVGLVTGLVPLALGWLAILWINHRMPVNPAAGAASEQEPDMAESDDHLPPLFWSLLPILLPVLLIGAASAATALGSRCPAFIHGLFLFLGNRHVALLIGVFIATGVLMRHRGMSLSQVTQRMGPPLETAAMVILIICAGGSFGEVLKQAGIGKAIAALAGDYHLNLIFLAYLVAVIIRIAQGSVTVAMITTASIVYPMMAGGLPYHPIYIFLAIGYGALFVSWMNDGGFWVVSKLGGLTEKQTLASWTVLTGVISLAGLAVTWVLSNLLPFAQK